MITTLRSSTLALVAMSAIGACSKPKDAPAAAAASSDGANTPVAQYGGKVITMKDVDARLGAELKKLDKQKLEARQRAAEQMAVQALVQEQATKEGIDEKAWFTKHVESAVPPPTEDAIKKVFEDNKAGMPPDATLESMRERIVAYLSQDQRRAQSMKVFDELKKQGGFKLLLEEPRTAVEAKGPAKGPADAKVTIVEFSDFECPFCSRAEESVTQVMDHYAGKVRLVFRHFPLPMHANAAKAAEAAACAEEQGKFWEMHKQLFANQHNLTVAELKAHAQSVGLDAAKFAECVDSGKMKAKVDADQKAGSEAGVSGTPAFFINGKMLSGAQPFPEFQRVIDAELGVGS